MVQSSEIELENVIFMRNLEAFRKKKATHLNDFA